MAAVDPFDGLDTVDGVKTVYRRLAPKAHPDTGGNVAAFTALNKAYYKAMQRVRDAGCPECFGEGKIKRYRGFNVIELPCHICRGGGK